MKNKTLPLDDCSIQRSRGHRSKSCVEFVSEKIDQNRGQYLNTVNKFIKIKKDE